ncbi:E3 ubiquitin-protein ligase NHLRC1-like [Dunckerocampus dactyliophorus]|uniref:E3 ubiquitin-protein ligase NHLRC1-like n=1 Tax=Dunckerocampus dactyliophorus TaxID=161453 RepID=UPI002406BD74|nr:E3 ubiquitin-protein ligase NHLRC1-like [Dunckerocampus dactyliophorus]
MAQSCPNRGAILSPEGMLREIQVNLLECKVCFEKFDAQQAERRPQNLSCGHVLCLECIRALSHPLLRKLECPFCRQLCSVDATSHCQALCDLQEMLFFITASPRSEKGGEEEAAGVSSKALHLCMTFGGWGALINPSGLAVMRSSGTMFVVHDGEERVVVLSPQGKRQHTFGPRGHTSGDVCFAVDVAVTPCGHVVVTDAGDKAVKVFTSRGSHVVTLKACFSLPWGVDTDSSGHILVTDVQAGTLSRLKVDYKHGVTQEEAVVVSDLQHPKAVAWSGCTGNTAVMEHVTEDTQHLTVFTEDFHILYHVDSFGLKLMSSVRMSGVAFDTNGHLLVVNSQQGTIWSFGNMQSGPVLTPLVSDQLIRPVGLVPLNNTLIVVDSGDHTVKVYS